jgi:D-alanyl-D-alanine carboxypeptidase
MLRAQAGVRRIIRWGALSLATILAVSALAGDTADARARRHRHQRAAAVERYEPAYASIVIDGNSGAVLQSTNPDSPRHPASLTKIMTLYLLFERLEAGKIKLSTELSVSPHAAAQAPSKLNLKPGDSIAVEDAIRAIVTKSANDVAAIVAEALGGSEDEFARLMTKKARALGMQHTTYRNASGLPDDQQITTARDQALLGRAIQERFPRYYRYFSTRTFAFRGHAMRNHNKLLGAVDGVDGIKTGYTHASGFNLVTSVRRSGRHIVAAVFGGKTASWRDARMHDLIQKHVMLAALKRTAPVLAESGVAEPAGKEKLASTAALMRTASIPTNNTEPAPGSTVPIKPNAVKTFTVKAASMRAPVMAALPGPGQQLVPVTGAIPATITTVATVKSDAPPPPGARPGVLGVLPAQLASAGDSVPVALAQPPSSAKPRGGWSIQVGAFDAEAEAKLRLNAAQSQAKDVLGQADPFTERVIKGDKTIYRARFAGLDKDQAETACKHLKRGEIPCMLLKN